jgi:hypothetical protein
MWSRRSSAKNRRVIVDVVQVIHDDERSAPGIAGAQPAKGFADGGHALAPPEQSTETVGVHVVEAQELVGPLAPMVRRAHPLGPRAASPGLAAQRAEFQRAPLVEADHRPRSGHAR